MAGQAKHVELAKPSPWGRGGGIMRWQSHENYAKNMRNMRKYATQKMRFLLQMIQADGWILGFRSPRKVSWVVVSCAMSYLAAAVFTTWASKGCFSVVTRWDVGLSSNACLSLCLSLFKCFLGVDVLFHWLMGHWFPTTQAPKSSFSTVTHIVIRSDAITYYTQVPIRSQYRAHGCHPRCRRRSLCSHIHVLSNRRRTNPITQWFFHDGIGFRCIKVPNCSTKETFRKKGLNTGC